MIKLWKRVLFCLLISAAVFLASVIADRNTLRDSLIRLHVVANSDSDYDQALKLKVRDAVLESINSDLQAVADVDAARAYLEENLPKIQRAANHVLKMAGVDDRAVVTLCREAFDTRYYDTFTLPAGVYEALRITIGQGQGHNWWCVAFPALCQPATTEAFAEAAVGSGFSETLTGSVAGKQTCQFRFFLLDKLGQLENKLFG